MKKYTIVNMVEIDGKDVRLDTLTPEQRKQLAIKWQDRIMPPEGGSEGQTWKGEYMEKIYRRMFRVAKNERDVWKARCEVATIIAVFFAFCNLWQYCR